MTQRAALVTGANSGLGQEVALACDYHPKVTVVSRDLARGQDAVAKIGHDAKAVRLDVDYDTGKRA